MFPEVIRIQVEIEEAGLNKLIIKLDHIAYRVKKGEGEKAMAELANLVPYKAYKTFTVSDLSSPCSPLP